VIPANNRINFTSPETRGIVLLDAENCTIVSSFVWPQYQNVTDGQTDRIPLAITALCIASQCGCAVKIRTPLNMYDCIRNMFYVDCLPSVMFSLLYNTIQVYLYGSHQLD